MPTAEQIQSALSRVSDELSLVRELLKNTLQWPVPDNSDSLEEISFEWSTEELNRTGLNEQFANNNIWQLQPLVDGQPWGIFILQFNDAQVFRRERGMIGPLRKVLDALIEKQRRNPMRPSWKREHLLFICTHDFRQFRFCYFKKPLESGKTSPLAMFGWDPDQPARTVCEYNLRELEWPSSRVEEDSAKWVQDWSEAFNVEKVTRRFFEDYSDVFAQVETKLELVIPDAGERRLYVQRLFNRLMFLRFIERKGWMKFDGRTDYLRSLCKAGGLGGLSLYKTRIEPLFFEALAINGRQSSDAVGEVKYLNGGLFERKPEDNLVTDVDDSVFELIIGPHGLFYRWNFTVEEATPLNVDVAVDPEMLGKVFEKLVVRQERKSKGAYYTPRHIVSFMCKETLKGYLSNYSELVDTHTAIGISVLEAKQLLKKLKDLRVIDPACGSGAYLLGMLHELHALNKLLDTKAEEVTSRDDYKLKLHIIQNNLYGVDIEEFAANTTCLRLWLSLAVEFQGDTPEPLPNLDFKIGVGDSLRSPNPETIQYDLFDHQLVRQLRESKQHFFVEDADEKDRLRGEIESLKVDIAQRQHSSVPDGVFNWTVDFAEVFEPRVAEVSITDEINLGYDLSPATIPGGFDIVIANPPYGAAVEDDVRNLFFDRRTEGAQSKDTYGLFMARVLQLLRPGGQFSFIVSDTWRTIKSHRPLRKRLLDKTTIKHVLDLPSWIFEATVNTCILTLTKGKAPADHKLIAGDLRAIEKSDWKGLADNLLAVANHGFDAQTLTYARYTYPQSLIPTYDNCSLFIGSPNLYRIMSDERFVKLSRIADVKVGLQTGDNEYYLRKRPGARGNYQIIDEDKILTEQDIVGLSEDEKCNGVDPTEYGGRHFVPYDKGGESNTEEGWLPNYYVPTQYYIDWSMTAVARLRSATIADVKRYRDLSNQIKEGDEEQRAAVIRNPKYYFRKGITFSDTGMYSPSFRRSSGSVFDQKGSVIVAERDGLNDYLLGVLASATAKYLFKSFINHSVSSHVDSIKELPVRFEKAVSRSILRLVRKICREQFRDAGYQYQLAEQQALNQAVSAIYGLSGFDIREIELWYCRRYPRLAEAQGFITEVKQKYADYLAHCDLLLRRPPSYWKSHPLLTLIAKGEGQHMEFKETLEADAVTGQSHPSLVKEVLKTMGAFANHSGGKLLIGVSDPGEIKGLGKDFRLLSRRKNKDGFEQKLRSLVTERLDPSPLGQVEIVFHEMPEGVVCEVTVPKSGQVIHVDRTEVYLRDGNRSIKLEGRRLTDWIANRERRV